jgi:hypothetical protein
MKFSDDQPHHFCEICGSRADPHEIISRGSGGPREPWNTIFLCFTHHREYHDRGRTTWARMYPQFADKIAAACTRAGRVMKSATSSTRSGSSRRS